MPKNIKKSYEAPDFIKLEIRDSILTFDSMETDVETETETENDDWEMDFIPF